MIYYTNVSAFIVDLNGFFLNLFYVVSVRRLKQIIVLGLSWT